MFSYSFLYHPAHGGRGKIYLELTTLPRIIVHASFSYMCVNLRCILNAALAGVSFS